jgi:hypothetical protein
MNNLFCIEILEEKPVISFDELLLAKYEIDNSVIRDSEDNKKSS